MSEEAANAEQSGVRSFGQVAFEAYAKCRYGLTHDNKPIPAWPDIVPGIRDAWETAALAAIWSAGNKDAWTELMKAYHSLKDAKPGDRSELDRRYAIAITKMEDLLAHFHLWIVLEGL